MAISSRKSLFQIGNKPKQTGYNSLVPSKCARIFRFSLYQRKNRKDDDGKHFSLQLHKIKSTSKLHIKGKFRRKTIFHPEIVDSALKDNPPTGVIRVRFPSHSGLEEVEIFNRLLEPSGGMKTEPNQKDLQKGIGLESKGIDQPTVDSFSPTAEQRENLEGQVNPNQSEVGESEQQQF